MSDNDTKVLIEQIDFGMEVEAFIKGAIGKYLVARAEDDAAEAMATLKNADPEDPKGIRDLQNRIKVADSVRVWLAEAIQAGHMAQQEFIDQSS